MRALDGTDLAKQGVGSRSGDTRRSPVATALIALLLICCVLGLVTTASAAPLDISDQASLARLALGQAQLYAPDRGARDMFGWSIALSGESALTGAPGHETAGKPFAGAAYVFTRSAGFWTAPVLLTAPDGAAYDQFGTSVALSGNTALIGAPIHEVAGTVGAGAVYVFTLTGGSWTPQATLTAAGGAAYDFFGESVALFGETALIGANGRDTAGQANAGAAYVFTRSGNSWTQQQMLTAPDAAVADQFGQRVALFGETALIGAPWHASAGLERAGAAYIFTRSGGSWTLEQKLTAPAPDAIDQFGSSVAISGETALIGAPFRASAAQMGTGAALVFVRSGASWTQQAELNVGVADDQFGRSVAISGETALIGAPFRDTAGQEGSGAAYVFARSGASWTQQAELTAPAAAAGDWFGWGLALSGDRALLSAPRHDTSGKNDAGTGYVFRIAPTVTLFTPASGPVGTAVTLTGGGFAGATSVTFNGIPAVFDVESEAQITATVPAGAISGTIAVITPGGTGFSAQSFTVTPKPAISKLSPKSGRRGATVTVMGTGFGATRGAGSVKFGSATCTRYVLWSATKITCKVPAKAKYGTVKVMATTAGGVSNARSFEVKR